MSSKMNQAVTKVKGLISENDELFEEFFIDTATFVPNTAKKKQYLKAHLDEIITKFIEKNLKIYPQYEDFLMDFVEWLDVAKFPLQQSPPTTVSTPSTVALSQPSTPATTASNPPPPPTSNTQAYQQQQQQNYKYVQQTQENHQNVGHRQVMPQQRQQTYWIPPRTQPYQNEETKTKRILMKLSDAFDQPQRRQIFFEEIKKEFNQRN